MNNLFAPRLNKLISLTCAILLVFTLVSSSFSNTASAETNSVSINDQNLKKELNSIVQLKGEFILNQELLELEEQINDYHDEVPYTEENFEAMSDEEFDKIYDTYFNSEEFLALEKGYTKAYDALEAQKMEIQPMIAPLLVPILASVARFALQTVVKHGTRVASTYLKKNIKSIGKNYTVKWNVKNTKGKVTTLLMIQHKKTKQPIFRLDNGSLHPHLKPGTTQWFWHFHIGGTPAAMKQHHSLRAIIPSKHKPKPSLTLY